MSRLRENIPAILTALVVVLFLAGIGYIKFQVWRTLHPTAPAWMFILDSK